MCDVCVCGLQVLDEKFLVQRRIQEATQGRMLELTAELDLLRRHPSPPDSPNGELTVTNH